MYFVLLFLLFTPLFCAKFGDPISPLATTKLGAQLYDTSAGAVIPGFPPNLQGYGLSTNAVDGTVTFTDLSDEALPAFTYRTTAAHYVPAPGVVAGWDAGRWVVYGRGKDENGADKGTFTEYPFQDTAGAAVPCPADTVQLLAVHPSGAVYAHRAGLLLVGVGAEGRGICAQTTIADGGSIDAKDLSVFITTTGVRVGYNNHYWDIDPANPPATLTLPDPAPAAAPAGAPRLGFAAGSWLHGLHTAYATTEECASGAHVAAHHPPRRVLRAEPAGTVCTTAGAFGTGAEGYVVGGVDSAGAKTLFVSALGDGNLWGGYVEAGRGRMGLLRDVGEMIWPLVAWLPYDYRETAVIVYFTVLVLLIIVFVVSVVSCARRRKRRRATAAAMGFTAVPRTLPLDVESRQNVKIEELVGGSSSL